MKLKNSTFDDLHLEAVLALDERDSPTARILRRIANLTYRWECDWRLFLIRRYARRML